jgi:hypothetical protein
VPIEWPDRLPIPVAMRFLEDAHSYGIRILGFTGGEPFLYPEFLVALTRRAVELGFRFDKLMTNGVWFRDRAGLASVLQSLKDAGFGGKIGLSVDKFHGIETERLATFCRTARETFGRDNILSLSYASRDPKVGLEPVFRLAAALDGVVEWSETLGRYLLVSTDLTITTNWNHMAPVERAEKLAGAWDGTWFVEDYCEGPGQALIVNPRGEVKPCCGFASDLDELTIGNIHTDTVARIVRRARRHPYVGKVFRKGLTAIRDDVLKNDPQALPGATSNHCFFCWHVLAKGVWKARQQGAANRLAIRRSLPLVDAAMRWWVCFDGKDVFVGPTAPATGRSYAVSISGSGPVPTIPPKMTWSRYQMWIDTLRSEGYALESGSSHVLANDRKENPAGSRA